MTATRVTIWLAATRPRTLPAAVAPVLVGTAAAWREGKYDGAAAGLCLLFAVLVQIGTNFANDYYDFIKGADTATRVGPKRAVASGLIPPATMKGALWVVFAAAFLSGLGLIAWGGPWLLAVGVASILCGFAYTGGPFPLGYHGLGDVFVFVFFGLAAVCTTCFVQAGKVTLAAWLAAVPIGLLTANILVVNNYRDVDTDTVAGKRTLVVRFGRGFARAQYGLSLVIALLVPLICFAYDRHVWSLLPLGVVPMAWSHFQRLSEKKSPSELIALLGDTGKLLSLYALLLAAGLGLGRAV